MKPWRVHIPVVADSHHFDEEQDLDPHSVKSWIRIRIPIKVKQIRNPVINIGNMINIITY